MGYDAVCFAKTYPYVADSLPSIRLCSCGLNMRIRQVCPKFYHPYTKVHGVMFQKTVIMNEIRAESGDISVSVGHVDRPRLEDIISSTR